MHRLFSRDDEEACMKGKGQLKSNPRNDNNMNDQQQPEDENILRLPLPSSSSSVRWEKTKSLDRIFQSNAAVQSLLSVVVDDRIDMWWCNDDLKHLLRVRAHLKGERGDLREPWVGITCVFVRACVCARACVG